MLLVDGIVTSVDNKFGLYCFLLRMEALHENSPEKAHMRMAQLEEDGKVLRENQKDPLKDEAKALRGVKDVTGKAGGKEKGAEGTGGAKREEGDRTVLARGIRLPGHPVASLAHLIPQPRTIRNVEPYAWTPP